MAYHESLDEHGLIGGSGATVDECGHCPAEQAALKVTLAAKPAATATSKAFSAAK